jgi:hypothetical protein
MKGLDKKSNNELQSKKLELSQEFETVKLQVVNTYDYWLTIQSDYHEVTKELNKRGLL